MVWPINTFTIHALIGFMVTASLAVMFYIVYFKAGRRTLDLLSANFILLTSVTCLTSFWTDNLIPAGMSSYGWPGGPTTEALRMTTLRVHRFAWVAAVLVLPAQLHFVLYYCRKRNFLRRYIGVLYALAVLVVPTLWTSAWLAPPQAPNAETSSWGATIPWMPTPGPAIPIVSLFYLAVQVYSLIQLWKTRGVSVAEFSESLGGRRIVFAALMVQMIVSIGDVVASALELPVPAFSPVGAGLMGILLAIAVTKSRVETDRKRRQLEREKSGLLECIPQPLLYLSADLKIQWTNDDAEALTGRSMDQLIGADATEIWAPEGEELTPLRKALSTGRSAVGEVARDDRFWMIYASPVLDDKDRPLGAIMLAMDITKIRQAEEALRNTNIKILSAREQERRRVAQDLHDSIAQGLTALQMQLRVQADEAGPDTPQGEQFAAASDRAGQLGKEVRQISHALYPPALDLLGLAVALEDIFEPYQASGIECDLVCSKDVRRARFSGDTEVALYRIAQEAINNAIRHGKATKISVELDRSDQDLRLAVIDNGTGFDVEQNSNGLGITSMTSRIEGVGGKLQITSNPGRTVLVATVPLDRAVRSPEGAGEQKQARPGRVASGAPA